MANENTQRRQLYLPKELEQWFIDESESTCVKVNSIMLEALTDYIEKCVKHSSKKKSDFEKDVRKIALTLLKEKGLI